MATDSASHLPVPSTAVVGFDFKKAAAQQPLLSAPLDESRDYTIEEALSVVGEGPFRYVVFCVLGLAYSSGCASLLLMVFIEPNVSCAWGLSGTSEAVLSAVTIAGVAVGSILFGSLADVYGRKAAALVSLLLLGTSGAVAAVAPNYPVLLVARCGGGLAIGATAVFFTMLSEFLTAKNRGYLLSGFELFWAAGALYGVALAWLILPTLSWRFLTATVAAIPLILTPAMALLPETPRFLLAVQRPAAAFKALETVARLNNKALPPGHLILPLHAQNSPQPRTVVPPRLSSLFVPQLKLVTLSLWYLSLITGFGYYTEALLTAEVRNDVAHGKCTDDKIKWDSNDYISILIDTSSEVPAVVFAAAMVERLGRAKSMTFALTATSASALVLLAFPSQVTLFLFLTRLWAQCCVTLLSVICPEVYPSTLRGFGSGVATSFRRFGGIGGPFIARTALRAFGLDAVSAVVGLFFFTAAAASLFLIPFETAGRAMLETVTPATVGFV